MNFNKLAWNAPKHGDEYGYLPTDEHYDAIVAWLATGTKKWKSNAGNLISTRVGFEGSVYDAIVVYHKDTKMINWVFRHVSEFQV